MNIGIDQSAANIIDNHKTYDSGMNRNAAHARDRPGPRTGDEFQQKSGHYQISHGHTWPPHTRGVRQKYSQDACLHLHRDAVLIASHY